MNELAKIRKALNDDDVLLAEMIRDTIADNSTAIKASIMIHKHNAPNVLQCGKYAASRSGGYECACGLAWDNDDNPAEIMCNAKIKLHC